MNLEIVSLVAAGLGLLSTVAFLILLVWIVRSLLQVRNQLASPIRGEDSDASSD